MYPGERRGGDRNLLVLLCVLNVYVPGGRTPEALVCRITSPKALDQHGRRRDLQYNLIKTYLSIIHLYITGYSV